MFPVFTSAQWLESRRMRRSPLRRSLFEHSRLGHSPLRHSLLGPSPLLHVALLRKSLATSLILVLTACAVGPDFKRPAAPEVDRYTAVAAPGSTASVEASGAAVRGGEAQALLIGQQLPEQWWQLFGSKKLDALVEAAFAGNPSVDSARAALTQAQEVLRAQKGALVPSVDAGLGAQRQKSFLNFGEPSVIGPLNLYHAGVDVSYGIDFFGAARRTVEAQTALAEYQHYELQATYLTLASNVVTASVQEASLRAQLEATQAIIAAQENQLQVSETQYQLGAIAYPQVLTARSEVAALRASLPTLQQNLASVQTQLAVYLGKLPMQHQAAEFALDDLTLPSAVPLGVPSELVRRRPDVRAAEALLHKASAEIGVATANLFPKVTLSGSYGGQSNQLSSVFDNTVWSVAANITQPLFHGGSLTAQRRAALAAYDGALADYRQTVLGAFKNVADALQAVIADAESLKAQREALLAADDSLKLLQQQYQLGGASFIDLLTAQRQSQQARINYLQRQASRYQDTAALMLALGGGWEQDTDPKLRPLQDLPQDRPQDSQQKISQEARQEALQEVKE